MNRRIILIVAGLAVLAALAALRLSSEHRADALADERGEAAATNAPNPSDAPVPPDLPVRHADVAPKFVGKPIPDLDSWQFDPPNFPPTGLHMEKLIRSTLRDMLGIGLPETATKFHYSGYFHIPPDDFDTFYEAFIGALHLDPETLEYVGPPPSTPALRQHATIYPGNDRFYICSPPIRPKNFAPATGFMLPLSTGTVLFRFVDRASRLEYQLSLDPKTGNALFGASRFDD